MNINIKRILKDINDLDKHNLNSHGIYHKTFEDDIYKLKVLMIGPSDTPYENGFYFITIPKNYPLLHQKLFIVLKMEKQDLIQICMLVVKYVYLY